MKVVGGKHSGRTGIILAIKDNSATILTINSNEITVMLNELCLSNEEQNEQGDSSLQRYDLIKLSGGMGPACLLMNQKDTLKVLDQHNSIRLINLLELEQKIDSRHNYAKNNFGQEIKRGAVVRIREGPKSGKKCEVKHVFKDILFLYNPEFYSTGSIHADLCTNVTLVSTSESFRAPLVPAPSSAAATPVKEYTIGATVMVQDGEWKGYQGVIKDIGKETLLVRLVAKCKTVQIRKDKINREAQQDWGKTPRPSGGQTVYRNSPGPANTPSRFNFVHE